MVRLEFELAYYDIVMQQKEKKKKKKALQIAVHLFNFY